ncbi:hypothetical protein [Roseicella frigidaeris]|uniref:Uncharacterized protein n=1 Tax=Roseicella frigidaeris TaxID=2230885 RepID=A0A327M4G2_9PROT|nr:hypothetical protein [Roseicella frigidaeris]RAI57275.1 hypothetical protein DOO78_19830 [Roseicella frigidaeris]
MTITPTIFADGILDANVSYGVARLTLAQTGPEGKPLAAGQLVVPLIQLPGIVNGLTGLLKQVETKIREQQAQQQAGTPAEPTSSAFRFG